MPPRPRDDAGIVVEASPNPFAARVLVQWSAGPGRVRVEVLDLFGRIVRRATHSGTGAHGIWT